MVVRVGEGDKQQVAEDVQIVVQIALPAIDCRAVLTRGLRPPLSSVTPLLAACCPLEPLCMAPRAAGTAPPLPRAAPRPACARPPLMPALPPTEGRATALPAAAIIGLIVVSVATLVCLSFPPRPLRP